MGRRDVLLGFSCIDMKIFATIIDVLDSIILAFILCGIVLATILATGMVGMFVYHLWRGIF